MPKNSAQSAGSPSNRLSISSDDVANKFAKKMKVVAQGEKEVETMRFAAAVGYPHINLERFPISQQALRQVSKMDAERLKLVCFYDTADEMRFAAIDPTVDGVQDLVYAIGERMRAHSGLYTISEQSFAHVLRLYDTLPVVTAVTKDISISAASLEKVQGDISDFRSLQTLLLQASTTDIVTYLLGAAFKLEASDIHVEAEEKQITVRFRLDGILHDAATLPREAYKQLISRIKLVSSLKINVTDQPQDGRFTIKLAALDVDVRVSTIPTVFGESVVMRLLRQTQQGLTLDDIGLRGDAYTLLKRQIERPNGMIITTGPTGSGKTTTLYAVMQILNEPGVKIITLEDPVEYRLEGVNQSQIDHEKDYTFAKGLRSMLRQDPDIAMVGEIRDLETADVAIQAALTGHLILSTIHTNNAAGAIPRFLSMGVKPFLLAPALRAVIGQRLVRRLCTACKKEMTLTPELQERVDTVIASMNEETKKVFTAKAQTWFAAVGCDVCHGIGYKGRLGIYEIFVMSPEVEQIILSGQVSEYDIESLAVKQGMVTMVQDGILKALDGMTSVEEVFKVVE